ncbi:hypothetical protein AgCh_006213 [Apium graveolens]
MKLQEGGVCGQRPPGVCLDGRPPPVANECPHWGCVVNFGASYPGDKDASNIWGEPWLYLRQRIREIAGSGRSHERNPHHIESIARWVELEKRLKLSVTIDSTVQEKITQEKKHRKQVLERILAIVKRLGRNNLAFRESPIRVQEFFNNFLKVYDTSRLGLYNELVEALNVHGLDIDNIRGQGYVNGSNVKGKNKGVQTRLLEKNLKAFYTPCACHSLNLILSDMAHCYSKAVSFFGVLQRIYSLFSASTKSWKVFTDHVQGLTVKPLSETRWESWVESVNAIRYQAPQIKEGLNYLVNSSEDAKTRSDAEILAIYNLQNFEFLLGMVIWYQLLYAINHVSKILQSEDMQTDVAIRELKGLLSFLQNYREVGFQEAMVEATEIANKMEVEPIFVEKRVNFEKLKSIEPEKLRTFFDNLANIINYGESSDLNGDDLYEDLCMLRRNLPEGTKSAIDVLTYIKKMEGSYPNAWIAYRILLTIPVTVVYAERSFSKLKLIKSYLRSTMSQERLNGLARVKMDAYTQEKIQKFEEFVDLRLKPDLVRAIAERDKVFDQQKTFCDLKRNIENLEKNSVTSLRTLVNLGSEVYVQADVPDTRHIFVDVGLGFHVEFTWTEALNYISVREEKLARQIEECTRLIASIKAQIKMVCEGIRELLQIPAE